MEVKMNRQTIMPVLLAIAAVSMAGCAPSEERAADEDQPATSGVLVTSDGSELPYSIDGVGIPCIVVGDPFTPAKVLSEELRRHIQFIFMYSRGNVPSESLGETDELTLETFLDDIEELRVSLDLDKTCVFGHSISGLYALAYARRYPHHTSHVIMHATPPGYDYEIQAMATDYWQTQASEERKENLRENWESRFDTLEPYPDCSWCLDYVRNGPMYWYDSTYDASWLLEGWYHNSDVGNLLLFDLLSQYVVDAGDGLTVPVFLALGEFDFVVPYFSWDERGSTLPNLSIHVFQESGHWPMLEEQALFDEKLIEWIHAQ
jgi:proline iminopeptidase